MAKKSKVQIWIEYIPARLVLDLLALLPRKTAVELSIFLARLAYPFLGKLRHVGHRNLEIAFPEKSLDEREAILKVSFENLGRILGELSQFRKATQESLEHLVEFQFESDETKRREDYHYYEIQRAKGRGVILVSPHLGNWEIGVFAYSAFREPISYLARPLDNPRIEDLIATMRARFGNRAINKTNSVGEAIKILNSGGILGFLPDVNAHPKEGVFVPFFGIPACTTAGVSMLALRTNALIVPMCTIWNEDSGRYSVKHGSRLIEAASTGDRHRDIVETTARYTAVMEEFIRATPEQWFWIHKRWKARPSGEKDIYAQ